MDLTEYFDLIGQLGTLGLLLEALVRRRHVRVELMAATVSQEDTDRQRRSVREGGACTRTLASQCTPPCQDPGPCAAPQ